jgi:hypothetical protein
VNGNIQIVNIHNIWFGLILGKFFLGMKVLTCYIDQNSIENISSNIHTLLVLKNMKILLANFGVSDIR